MNKETTNKVLSLKTINKSNVWDIQENDVFRLWEAAEKDADLKDNMRHYIDILKSAFDIEEITVDKPEVIKKYEARGFKVGPVRIDENTKMKWGVKKHPILRVTDLTYENIHHISAAKLMEVIDRNFGGGWDSLSQSIQDIIQSGFDISTTTLPQDRLHKPGGMYEKKVEDGFEVLEIPKGTWVEAIFAKLKPETIKPRMRFDEPKGFGDEDDDDADVEIVDDYNSPDEDDVEIDDPNDDEINENNYRTTFDIAADPDEDAESLSDFIADE